jgi:insertion element IS1 protein InsB
MPKCPECGSERVVKNGRIHNGKQNHRCRSCGRQFVENPEQKRISEETKVLIDKLLLERIPLAGIARVCDVSERWLQSYVNHLYESVDQHVEVEGEKGGPAGAPV